MAVFDLISLSFCDVVKVGEWNEPPHRFFTSYRRQGDYRWLLGHAVVDEFDTISSPIFLTPRPLLGKIYNAGISLGHRRDHEMAIDFGWPPLCAGVDRPVPKLPPDWERELLSSIQDNGERADVSGGTGVETRDVGRFELSSTRLGDVTVVAASAPLLPVQLARICDLGSGSLTIAFATGNKLARPGEGEPQRLEALSENALEELMVAAKELLS